MIGKRLSPTLAEIEMTLWEFENRYAMKPDYTMDGFRGALKIAMSAIMDKMWELQDKEQMDVEDRGNMATACGEEFSKFIKKYTDIDTLDLYK